MAEDRAPFGGLTEKELEQLVERVSEQVMANFYQSVVKGVLSRLAWIVGIVVVSLVLWLASAGKLKFIE